ncbi:hypothetical protein KDA_24400 [Dictyobacter alpinus]|uniref:Uncharacterized protein n=1 Tax=Dictyobacter alpinus TaxID=2014873 RepID=A0A402B6H6_9CHLR|nr:hypothetical protein KDA_24400 [Dictyobacter alpinus]
MHPVDAQRPFHLFHAKIVQCIAVIVSRVSVHHSRAVMTSAATAIVVIATVVVAATAMIVGTDGIAGKV